MTSQARYWSSTPLFSPPFGIQSIPFPRLAANQGLSVQSSLLFNSQLGDRRWIHAFAKFFSMATLICVSLNNKLRGHFKQASCIVSLITIYQAGEMLTSCSRKRLLLHRVQSSMCVRSNLPCLVINSALQRQCNDRLI